MKIILLVGVLVVIAAGGYFYWQSTQQDTAMENGDVAVEEDNTTAENGDSITEGSTHMVTYSNSGYSPESITIQLGDTVTFTNNSSGAMWPATAVHPSHTVYPGSAIEKCFDGSSDTSLLFDACGDVQPGGEYSFTFTEAGTWRYHDHRRATETGTIIVQ